MAPVIFNLYMAAVTTLSRQRSPNEKGISLTYRLDGSVFNLSRLQARTKTSRDQVVELQYADESMMVTHSTEELQCVLTCFPGVYKDLGLVINTHKTEVMFQWTGA